VPGAQVRAAQVPEAQERAERAWAPV